VFDGEVSWFLIVIFVLWVLESIAKARGRSRSPDQGADEDQTLSAPSTLEAPTEARPKGPPRTLWEEIAEIARQQQEQRLPTEQRHPEGSERGPRRRPDVAPAERPEGVPLPRRRAELSPAEGPKRPGPKRQRVELGVPSAPPERTASTRWQQGIDEEAVVRPAPVEATGGDERRSDRWLYGGLEEGASTEGGATYDSLEARARSSDLAPRARSEQAASPKTAVARTGQPRGKVQRSVKGRPALRGTSVGTPLSGAPAERSPSRLDADVHNLRGASRAELRRILILTEVLGPPLALRDESPSDV
jgi:hypothetical protein